MPIKGPKRLLINFPFESKVINDCWVLVHLISAVSFFELNSAMMESAKQLVESAPTILCFALSNSQLPLRFKIHVGVGGKIPATVRMLPQESVGVT